MKVRFAVSAGFGPPEPAAFGAMVEEVEARGFDTVWLADLPSIPSMDPWLGVAFAAARTRRLHIGANFIPFGSSPYLVAHRLATLDQLTGGRLLVTLVPGLDLPAERAAVGTAGRHRGRMMEELVPHLRALWAGESVPAGSVSGSGSGDGASDGSGSVSGSGSGSGSVSGSGSGSVSLPVRPVQEPLEVWLGGSGPDAIMRAGRVADGWLGSLASPGRAGRIRRAIVEAAAEAGRVIDPEHFGLSVGYARSADDIERAAASRFGRVRLARRPGAEEDPGDLVPVGADALRRYIGQLVDEGLSKFVIRPIGGAGAGGWSEELAWLADVVLPLQT